VSKIKKECDKLWAECVKAKARYKSELSGREGKQIGGEHVLNAHHLRGKSSYRLRYELKNGYCCTKGEHKWGFHNEGRKQDYENQVAKQRPGIFDFLAMIKNHKSDDIRMIKMYLEKQLIVLKRREVKVWKQ